MTSRLDLMVRNPSFGLAAEQFKICSDGAVARRANGRRFLSHTS